MSIEQIFADYRGRKYFSSIRVTQPKYRDDHVFDADKSVNWNRAEVKRQNDIRAEMIRLKQKEDAELQRKFISDVTDAMHGMYRSIPLDKAEKIVEKLWGEADGDIDKFDTLLDIVFDCIEIAT